MDSISEVPSNGLRDISDEVSPNGARADDDASNRPRGESSSPAAGPLPSNGGAVNEAPAVNLKDLFGALFQIDASVGPATDPILVDTRAMLREHFGEYVHEDDLNWEDEGNLTKEMEANKAARQRAELERLFGVAGADALSEEKLEVFSTLCASVPQKPSMGDALETWLAEMPKIVPNRQILHADPQPFLPSTCQFLESNARMLYTPHNIMRWAYHRSTNTYMSNTRVVRWSDGSQTLHVGGDVHSLQASKEVSAMHLLGKPTEIRRGDVVLPAFTATTNPDRHLVMESGGARSVEKAVIAESMQHRAKATKLRLPFITEILPSVDWNKPDKNRNPYEAYVAMEYERRRKTIERRMKEGNPMSLMEQMAMEQEMLQHLQSTGADLLAEQQEEAARETALRGSQRNRRQDGPQRSRLDRDLGLGGDPGSIFVNDDSSIESDGSRDSSHDYEAMLEEMHGKRTRKDADVGEMQRQKVMRVEQAQVERFAPLIESLQELAGHLSVEGEAYGSVRGTLDFLLTGSFSSGIVEKEIPLLLQEVAEEQPSVDISRVKQVFSEVFPSAV